MARRRSLISTAEAASILGVLPCTVHVLARRGRLNGELIDRPGQMRKWQFKRANVIALKNSGQCVTHGERIERVLWKRYFGEIPEGARPAFKDGNRQNYDRDNLYLIYKQRPQKKEGRKRANKAQWSKTEISILRREAPRRLTPELATILPDRSIAAIRRMLRHLGIRRNPDIVRKLLSGKNSPNYLPVGTERLHVRWNTIYVKVAETGPMHKKWRPKHFVVWEKANDRPLPDGYRVLFKDGNRMNFAPENLEAMSRNEMSALANIRFRSYPKVIQDLARISTKIKQEAERALRGETESKAVRTNVRKGGRRSRDSHTHWTPDMDTILEREWPRRFRWEVAAQLGVTESAAFNRAKRLNIQRLPETRLAEARARAEASEAADMTNAILPSMIPEQASRVARGATGQRPSLRHSGIN